MPKTVTAPNARTFNFRFKKSDTCGWKGLVGPDYFGCVNSGRQPVVVHDRMSGLYVVGHKTLWDCYPSVRTRIRADRMVRDKKTRVYRQDGMELRVYETRAAAVAKFEALCAEVVQKNARDRAEVQDARRTLKDARPGSKAATRAALTLNDHGLL
jgi:hypothetical protein